jgi:hypothetical protein
MKPMTRIAVGLVAAAVLIPASANAQSTNTRLSYTVPASESGNVAVDSSDQHNDGVLKGGVTRRHGAYKFHPLTADGKFDRIVAPDDPSLSPGTSPFTYSVGVKVKPDAVWENSEMAILRHGDSETAGGDYKMELHKSLTGVVSAECVMHDDDAHGSGYVRGTGEITINDGHWHTITCGRVSVDTVSLTIDGHTTTRTTHGSLANIVESVPLLIGCQNQGRGKKEQFVGKMDDITLTVGT